MKRRRAFAIAVACSAANSCDASVSSLTALALFRHRWQAFVSLLVKGWHKTPRNNRSSVYSEGTMTGAVHLDPARITFMVRQDAQASDLGRCGGLEGHGIDTHHRVGGDDPKLYKPYIAHREGAELDEPWRTGLKLYSLHRAIDESTELDDPPSRISIFNRRRGTGRANSLKEGQELGFSASAS